MEEYLNRWIEDLSQWNPLWTYGALMISAFLENVIPPIPGDAVVVFSAYLVGRDALNLWLVYLATCLGGTAGFAVMYYLGYSQGRTLLSASRSRFFSSASIAKAGQWLARYGTALILVNRFLTGIRSVIAITAGIGGMGWKKVVLCGLVSMGIWNGILLYAGLLVGRNWGRILEYIDYYNRVFATLAVGILVVLLWRMWRKRRKDKDLTGC